MIQFLRRLFGYTCCTEFTQWETKEAAFERAPRNSYELLSVNIHTGKYRFTRSWQERHCPICGKVQQRDLDY